MKKQGRRKLLAAIVLFSAMMIFCSLTVLAKGHPYDRSGSVAATEELYQGSVPAAASNGREWKKINGKCYNGSGELIEGAFLRGVDISEWQGVVNWSKVADSDVDFAFIRISDGMTHMDYRYDYNMTEAIEAGIPVGTYIYSRAVTKEAALEEAQMVIRKMNGYKISYPVVFDMECSAMQQLSSRELSELAVVFCEEIKKAGYFPMIYTNVNWYRNEIDWSVLGSYDVWLAHFGDRILAPSHEEFNYTIWQATDGNTESGLNPTRGLISGVPSDSDVDLDFGFKDYTKVITPRKKPLSSYTPSELTDVLKGWQTIGGETYYYKNGKPVTGWKKIDGKYYRFHLKTGKLLRNYLLSSSSTGIIRYVGSDGVRYENKWLTYKGEQYYFNSSGQAVKGWNKIDGVSYRFHIKTAVMLKNRMFVDSKGNIRYVGADGKQYVKKWLTYKGKRYRFNGSGIAWKGGWIKIGTKYYYFNTEDGSLYKDCRILVKSGNIYFTDRNGWRISNGFYTDKKTGYTYYLDEKGRAYKGWHVIDGKSYYFYKGTSAKSGTRAENITLVDSKNMVSVFDKNGVCVKRYKKKS